MTSLLQSRKPRGLKRTVAPTFQAVDTATCRQHARIYITDEDALLAEYIESATEYVERQQNRCLRASTWQATYDAFADCFEIPIPPLVSVSSIAYLDESGATHTLSTNVYAVDAVSEPGRISPKSSQTWPSTLDQINAVTVTFVAGHACADLIPQRTRQAIRMLAAHWFQMREAVAQGSSAEVPLAVADLINADRFVEYR